MPFILHPRLAAGGFDFGVHRGCRVLLKNNAIFPWFILVPEVGEEIEDLHQLDAASYQSVTGAIRDVSCFVSAHFRPAKLNVAAIGNQVRQLHIHIVGRSPGDPAWPGVVWAFEGKQPYDSASVEEVRAAFEEWIRSGHP